MMGLSSCSLAVSKNLNYGDILGKPQETQLMNWRVAAESRVTLVSDETVANNLTPIYLKIFYSSCILQQQNRTKPCSFGCVLSSGVFVKDEII
jgi:hypothetical protein